MRLIIFTFILICRFIKSIDFDIFIYSATPSGIQAALAAAGEGKSVLLATPMPLIGGMMTSGLGATDKGHTSAIGGCAKEFFQLVCKYYNSSADACYTFEPHVAESIFIDLIKNNPGPGIISVYLNSTLIATEVNKNGKGLAAVTLAPTIDVINAKEFENLTLYLKDFENNNQPYFIGLDYVVTISASVFIDSSYEGDLIALSGLQYYVGRESNETYNESFAGVLAEPSPYGSHQFEVYINPYQEGNPTVPIKFVQAQSIPIGSVNSADKKVQAYNFRLCMTQNRSNSRLWEKPANYCSTDWELLIRYIIAANITDINSLIRLNIIPNGKTDTNNFGPISTDMIGGSWTWADAKPYQRQEIYQKHKEYTLGFFYFLSSDKRVPLSIQNELNTWGLCSDEWNLFDNFPPQLYVRESRRLIGDFIFTQRDREYDWYKNDSIGLYSYNIDSHHVQRYINELSGGVLNEGDFELFGNESSGQMPYRLLLPSINQQVGYNILSSVALSASHMGYGCLRLEPQLMILGQGAGIAAAQAIDENTSVQNINIEHLQSRLRYLGAKIDL